MLIIFISFILSLYYNRFMRTKQFLLSLYLNIQWCFTILNLILLILVLCMIVAIYILGQGLYNPLPVLYKFIIETVMIISGTGLYAFLTYLSAISTKNIIQNKPLTKLQKFSAVIFPIITVPLYSYLIFKLFIQYR